MRFPRTGIFLLVLIVVVAILALHGHHCHHRLKAKIVVDQKGRACYLDRSNGRIYYYVLNHGHGDYYTPSGYDTDSPTRISLPAGGTFVSSPQPASAEDKASIEAVEQTAEQHGLDVQEVVEATADQIANWENEGGAIDESEADANDAAGDAADGDGGGDSGGGDAGGGDDGGGGDGGDGGD